MSEHDMQLLLELVEKHLGASWVDVVEHLRDINSLDDIAERVSRGDIDGAVKGIEDAAKAFAAAQHESYVEAGQQASAAVDGEVDGLVRFDVANHRAANWARTNSAELVRDLGTEQRDLVRRVISDGVADGRNPREVARDLRQSIGLTDYQASIVDNYRRALEGGQYGDALSRELSDGRDDRTVAAAQRNGDALSQKQIDDMVERYRSNWVSFRAETIARTEGLRVAHQGTLEGFQQAIDAGHLEADQLEREWHHTSGGKSPRETHREMNGQKRGIDEPFDSGSGASLMYPGDPSADPSETLNCRCAVSTRMTF